MSLLICNSVKIIMAKVVLDPYQGSGVGQCGVS